MSEPSVLVRERQEGAVVVLLLDRPPLNLLNQALRGEVADRMETLAGSGEVRAVVLAGAGEVFCAGADMREFPLRFDRAVAREHCARGQRLARSVALHPKPVVAAIEGHCLGGGLELAAACDFRVAAATARLGFPEVRRGVFPGTGGPQLLARLVGRTQAKLLMMRGAALEAEAARALGLVDEVVAPGEALGAALSLAEELAAQPAAAVRSIKRLVDAPWREEFEARLVEEVEHFEAIFQTSDAREGYAAFFEKREPRFAHR